MSGISIISYSPDDADRHDEIPEILRTLRDERESRDKPIEEPLGIISEIESMPPIPAYAEIGRYTPNALRKILNSAVSSIRPNNLENFAKDEEIIMEFYSKYGPQLNLAWYVDVKGENEENLFHDYVLVEEVNKGSFGKIYRAVKRDDPDNSSLAIKVLLQEVNKDIDYLNCFRRGVRAMELIAKNNIPGVVKIHKAFEVPNSIVMDYIEGYTLREAIDDFRQIRNFGSKLEVIKQVSETIFAAHSLQESVLHRDIKPENIILENYFSDSDDDDIRIKIVDFDLAWHRGATERTVMATGSIGFVAPEQALENAKRDTRSKAVDVYSIGMLLYYLLLEENPPANYHFASNFREDIINKLKSKYRTEWRVLPVYIADTIVEATRHVSTERITLSSFLSRLEIIKRLYLDNEIDQTNFMLLRELAESIDSYANVEAKPDKSEVIINQDVLSKKITLNTRVEKNKMVLNIEIYKSRGGHDARAVRDYFQNIINRARKAMDTALFRQTNLGREEETSAIRISFEHILKKTLGSDDIKELARNITEISQELQFQ